MAAIRAFSPQLSIRSQTNLFPACKPSRFPLTSFPGKHAHLVPLKATTLTLACEDEENNRKFRKLGPSEWRHKFLSAHVDFSTRREIEALRASLRDTVFLRYALRPKVRDMFIGSKLSKKNIIFIYLLVSLGVTYHFEDEIRESIKDGFPNIEEMIAGEDDLYTVSIIFWVFRIKVKRLRFKNCFSY
ncbi:hypothetical protein EUTSA_v10012385mg [Eutrema salsugineum]|uniref:Terpene synthase N-terminal domain-containing protein n=1 Tax=Eutrema salsugineum TaxID=72664 RepID=V4KL36_EUTSA|nr:hypothetical protein EUTSA_v10012385mg [Eutrema salsugineum]